MLMACRDAYRLQRLYANCNCGASLAFAGDAAAAFASVVAADGDDETDLDGEIVVAVDADTNSLRGLHWHSHGYLCRSVSVVYLRWPRDVHALAVDFGVPSSAVYSPHFSRLYLVPTHSR